MSHFLQRLLILTIVISITSCMTNLQDDSTSEGNEKDNSSGLFGNLIGGTSGSGNGTKGKGGGKVTGYGSGFTNKSGSNGNALPTFNWPPPKPSAFSIIDRDLLKLTISNIHIGKVERILRHALIKGGYFDVSYYAIESQPDAFVMVTRLEKINDNATSVNGKERWVTNRSNDDNFSLTDYFSALFYAKPGKYRIIAFIVSAQSIQFDKNEINTQYAKKWISDGSPSLTREIRRKRFTDNHQITALVYEFENKNGTQSTDKDSAFLIIPGIFQTRTHLEQAGIWHKLINPS